MILIMEGDLGVLSFNQLSMPRPKRGCNRNRKKNQHNRNFNAVYFIGPCFLLKFIAFVAFILFLDTGWSVMITAS